MKRRDLEQEIQQAFDGDESHAADLRESLLKDPAALDLWCDYALLESELRRQAKANVALPTQRRKPAPKRHSGAKVWGLAAAAVLALSLSAWLMFRGGPLGQGGKAMLSASPESIVRDAAGDLFPDGELATGNPLTLARGVVSLDLPGGGRAVIEGPATFTLLAKDRLEVDEGLSRIDLHSRTSDLTIVAPGLEVKGKGEFGIDQRDDYPMAVHAFAGGVEVVSISASGESASLKEGEAASRITGRWTKFAANRLEFLNELPPSLPLFHMSFDRIANNSLEIDGNGLGRSSSVASLQRPQGARLVPGVKGMALEMDGSGSWITTTWPGIAGTAPRTVSLWCRLPAGRKVETAPPFALWGNPKLGWNRKFKVASVTTDEGRVVLRASFGEYYANGTREIADGKWHHLAVVYRGLNAKGEPLMEFYVDGERDGMSFIGTSGDIYTQTELGDARALSIGRYELPPSGNPYFVGAIDELRIHAGALDATEIRKLAERP